MSVTPDLRNLIDALTALEQGVQGQETLDQLLNDLLPRLLPEAASENTLVQAQVEASSAIFRAGDAPGVLEAVMAFTGGHYSHAHLALRDDLENPSQLHIVAEANAGGARAGDRYTRFETYPAADTLEKLETFYHAGAEGEPFVASAFAEAAGEVRALVIVPLPLGGRMTGLIALSHNQPVVLSAAHLRGLNSLAEQAAAALENARLLADLQRHARQLEHIAGFSRAVQQTLDIETIIQTMLDELRQAIPIDHMNVALYDPVVDTLRVVAQYEDGKSRLALAGGPLLSTRGAFVGRAWEDGEFVHTGDIYGSAEIRQVDQDEVRSLMIAPLLVQGRRLGLVNAGNRQPHVFRETDAAAFRQMTDQLAVALANAETYAQSQRKADNEAFVNALATRLEKQTDIRQMLDIALRELGAALGARSGRIRLSTEGAGGPNRSEG